MSNLRKEETHCPSSFYTVVRGPEETVSGRRGERWEVGGVS